jgi:hypothetical protein
LGRQVSQRLWLYVVVIAKERVQNTDRYHLYFQ